MISVRRGDERGGGKQGWLDSRHTFSFGHYYDPKHMGFRALRVINEDRVAPGKGFGKHGHRDMEIVSYVLEGALEHKDSLGTGSVIRPGDVQRMSAGTGIRHSEFNPSRTEPLHFLQIWLLPEENGITPSYEQKTFADSEKHGRLRLVASRKGREGSVLVHQDADYLRIRPRPRRHGRARPFRPPQGMGPGDARRDRSQWPRAERRRRRGHRARTVPHHHWQNGRYRVPAVRPALQANRASSLTRQFGAVGGLHSVSQRTPVKQTAGKPARGSTRMRFKTEWRRRDLLQGLGCRAACGLQPWLAAQRGRMGQPDAVPRVARLPRRRA